MGSKPSGRPGQAVVAVGAWLALGKRALREGHPGGPLVEPASRRSALACYAGRHAAGTAQPVCPRLGEWIPGGSASRGWRWRPACETHRHCHLCSCRVRKRAATERIPVTSSPRGSFFALAGLGVARLSPPTIPQRHRPTPPWDPYSWRAWTARGENLTLKQAAPQHPHSTE